MTSLNYNISVFLSLVRAGLWTDVESTDFRIQGFMESVDWDEVYQLAEEQSVIGIVLAGIEHSNIKPPHEELLQWIGEVQILEQQNKAMNQFIEKLIEKLRSSDIFALLLKGQGVAQCYERPLWRTVGDVDLFLSDANYFKTEKFLVPMASSVDEEISYAKHKALTIDEWTVELHGSLRNGLWRSLDRELDKIQYDIFCGGNLRSWLNGKTQVFIPRADEDVVYVFAHILQHFYQEGIGLKQICDWSRLNWTFRDSIDRKLLEKRLFSMGAMTEWKAFAALAVDYLGMPKDAMPFYSDRKWWGRKAKKIFDFIIETGNFGHNRDFSYYDKSPYAVIKLVSLWRHITDTFKYFTIFPIDSMKVFLSKMKMGIIVLLMGK